MAKGRHVAPAPEKPKKEKPVREPKPKKPEPAPRRSRAAEEVHNSPAKPQNTHILTPDDDLWWGERTPPKPKAEPKPAPKPAEAPASHPGEGDRVSGGRGERKAGKKPPQPQSAGAPKGEPRRHAEPKREKPAKDPKPPKPEKPKREKPAKEPKPPKPEKPKKETPKKEPRPEPVPAVPAEEEKLTVGGVIGTVFTVIICIAAVALVLFTVVSLRTTDQGERDLFGYKAFIVRSDSMSATDFSAGDLVVVKEVAPATLKVGDIIAFSSNDPVTMGETYTHKIRAIGTDEEGETIFTTYGTTTGVDDLYPVYYEDVQGLYIAMLPRVGTFVTFLKTVPGYLCCIFLPFMLLLCWQVFRGFRLNRKIQQEETDRQLAELQSQRDALAAQQAENERILQQLRSLRDSEP